MIFELIDEVIFPQPSLAEEDGLLAIGGDLSEERLLLAYSLGIFPWYSADEPILWFSPHERFVLFPHNLVVSHSMKQLIKSGKYEIRWDTAFKEVMLACAQVPRKGQDGTWINDDMVAAYCNLNSKGIARSVEVWRGEELVGGLYGVAMGAVFCGESMFSKEPNTSKLALIALCQSGKYELIDCQVHTLHLESMGASFISRKEFEEMLKQKTPRISTERI
ncbi:MAG TPA: leucyl/phenylalanyl-tRNA--protein transferase [Chitinophagales bacterium]|nr:leucyl/phenylalanyl-tRNA--protein transferase [Chitinophagales bacterium]